MYEDYNEVDSISDDVLHLGSGLYLRFVVKLSKKNQEGSREPFHKEYRYNSKYVNQRYSRTIRRSFDYYLLLERKYSDADCYIQIRPNNMIIFGTKLQSALEWLFDNRLFILRDNKMHLTRTVEMIKIQGLPMNNWIGLEPIPVYYQDSNVYDKGIRIYLSSEDKYVDISGNSFMGLIHTINTFDMYGSATNLINYLQRPELGTNMKTFEDYNDVYNSSEFEDSYMKTNTTRKIDINRNKNKTFFDKIDEL